MSNLSLLEFSHQYMKIKDIFYFLNNILLHKQYNRLYTYWKNNTCNNRYNNSIKIAIECFEKSDINITGFLTKSQIYNALLHFYSRFKLKFLYENELFPNFSNKDFYNIRDWINILKKNSFLKKKITYYFDNFINNKISICNRCDSVMRLYSNINDIDNYSNNESIICDFSLQYVKENILHCCNSKAHSHPFGFDIDSQLSIEYFDDYFNRRLEDRLWKKKNWLLVSNKLELHRIIENRRKYICNLLINRTINLYSNIKNDIKSSEITDSEDFILRQKLKPLIRILSEKNDWNTFINDNIYRLISSIKDTFNNLFIQMNPDNQQMDNQEKKNNIIKNFRNLYMKYSSDFSSELKNIISYNNILIDINCNWSENYIDDINNLYDMIDNYIDKFYENIEILENMTLSENIMLYELISTNDIQCSICMSLLNDNDIGCKLKICNHIFHKDCILKWLSRNNTCPICRS